MRSFADHSVINEGGAFGHLSHPFDIQHFTFKDMTDIITNVLSGNLDYAEEKCLHKDTIVVVDGKQTPISEVVDNDVGSTILSYNTETKEFVNMPIMAKVNNGPETNWIEIELEDGKTIRVTESHRILTDSGYKKAADLSIEDDIICY